MKTNLTMILSLSLLVSGTVSAFNLANSEEYKRLSGRIDKVEWVRGIQPGQLCPDVFIEAIQSNIQKALADVMQVVQDFATPSNPQETFSQYIERCRVLSETIENEILKPLEAETKLYAQDAQQVVNHSILIATEKIVRDINTKFLKVYKVLLNHLRSKKPNDAAALIAPLKPQLLALMSAATLNMLDSDLAALQKLLADKKMAVAQDIQDLRALINKVKSSVGSLSQKEELELLAKIRRRLQRL
jgi:hypothetical protein